MKKFFIAGFIGATVNATLTSGDKTLPGYQFQSASKYTGSIRDQPNKGLIAYGGQTYKWDYNTKQSS